MGVEEVPVPMTVESMLSEAERRQFNLIWENEGKRPPASVSTRPDILLLDRWRRVADLRVPEAVRAEVMDSHVALHHAHNDVTTSSERLELFRAFHMVNAVYLHMLLPSEKRKHLTNALRKGNQPMVAIEAAELYFDLLLTREEQGGSVEPVWEDMQEAVMTLVESWARVWDTVLERGGSA